MKPQESIVIKPKNISYRIRVTNIRIKKLGEDLKAIYKVKN